MSTRHFIFSLIITSVFLGGCQAQSDDQRSVENTVILISIDGFRYDYFDLGNTPNLERIASSGLRVDSLHHVYPTKTFPTHYTVVTGLHPGHHGLVANSMWDPDRDARFSLGNREAVEDGFWYEGGEPIWVTAENQGVTAATFFWPGSEAQIRGVRPTYWKVYDGDVPHSDRIEQVLEWIDMPKQERPRLITLYFSTVDSAGHRYGPREEPVREALEEIDAQLGVLLDGLEARGATEDTYLLLASDHGMSRVDFDRYIMLDEYLDLTKVTISDWGPATQIWATGMPTEEIVQALTDAHPHMRVWAKADLPPRYQFDTHRRVPDVVAEADLGWMISNKPYMAGRSQFQLYGMHGWDPALKEMHGGFTMMGPGIVPGSQSPSVRSVDLYELVAHLLNIKPSPNDGNATPFMPFLTANAPVVYETLHFDCQSDGEVDRIEARIAPMHLALHWREEAHVMDRLDPANGDGFDHHFGATGLSFAFSDTAAHVEIDDRYNADCVVAH
jgi:predicted AlkP superfamily pyrophosphatase or phosphodiesterase